MKITFIFIAFTVLQAPSFSFADSKAPPASVFAEALKIGKSDTTLPPIPQIQSIAGELKRRSGNPGEIKLSVRSLFRFKQQPKCGRVIFFLSQPATSTAWIDTGGQINVCEDGNPPLRTCRATPSLLTPPNSTCPDGSRPIDTAEIAQAISQATSNRISVQSGSSK